MPLEGGLIKRDWLVYYDHPPANGRDVWIVQSWDTAYKPGEYNDYSVCTTWVVKNQDAFLIDVWRARVDFPAFSRWLWSCGNATAPTSSWWRTLVQAHR